MFLELWIGFVVDYCSSLYCGMQSKIVLELKYKAPEGSRGGVGDRERGGDKEAGM